MRRFLLFIITTGLAVLFAGCGELDAVFPSQGTYRVNARVDNDHTLDEYSIVHHSSSIRPFFENSVTNDPDIRGLIVFVQNSGGTTVSRKVQYLISNDSKDQQDPAQETPAKLLVEVPPPDSTMEVLAPVLDDNLPAEVPAPDSAGEFPTETDVQNPLDPETPSESPPSKVSDSGGLKDPPPAVLSAPVSIEEPPAKLSAPASTGKLPAETDISHGAQGGGTSSEASPGKTQPVQAAGENRNNAGDPLTVQAAGQSGTSSGENPTVPDTAQAAGENRDKPGDSIMVQAAGQSGTSSEASPDSVSAAEAKVQDPPPKSDANPPRTEEQSTGSREYKDEIILVKTLEQYLPAFQILEELDIGQYNIVFQVMGDQEVLYRSFKPIYFLADADFTLGEIQSYLPATNVGKSLIPPGINVVLETEISADKRLDPYIIWQYGKKIIAQGRKSAGANYILWKTPEQPGLLNIRAEVFPLLPGDRLPANMLGKFKSLSLPVSTKVRGLKYFDEKAGTFTNWYQLWGNLEDTKAPGDTAKQLQTLADKKPRWIPHNGIYGLSTGPQDVYTLPGKPFTVSAGELGKGRILLRLAPLDGTILHAAFAAGGGLPGNAELNLSAQGETLVLELSSYGVPKDWSPENSAADTPTEDEPLRQSLTLNLNEADAYISLFIYFEIAPNRFSAKLSLENPDSETALISLPLANPLTGDSTVLLGARKKPESRSFDTNDDSSNEAAILNELALAFTQTRYEGDAFGGSAEETVSPP
ncbi:putative lipoprotein [Treponema primitia ZAS-2]|uniref:Putative lipoprotein n=1 Tax=Treponema primitia (strain ATCC BAA-887 / DSM 12427 / ZAS-2) TaxID=545694 RepID=F5YHB9_TREPZ|nr:lipoprotein [Treponema primitia]AEF86257.1 putative lipoprotein [Treponema primitia ZAS-2]